VRRGAATAESARNFRWHAAAIHANFHAHMKSLRITSLAFLLVAATGLSHAADSTKSSAKADKKSAAKSDDSGLPDPVAVVEGVKIKRAELEKEFTSALASAGKSATELTKEQKQQGYRAILQDIIIDRLLRKRSADLKVNEEEVNKNIEQLKAQFPSEDKLNEELKKSGQTLDGVKENIRTSMRQQQWIEARIAGKTDVSDAEVKAFYDEHPESFKQPEMVRASHILIMVPQDAKPEVVAEKKKLIDAAAARVAKGEDFNKVASEVSEDPSAKQNGGDLNFFAKGQMVPEFSDAAFKLEKGKVSDPVKTQYGFHIIKVTDKKDAKTVTFDEAKEKITGYLKEQKKRAAVNELIASVREKADVKVNLPALEKPAPDKALQP
jgi:peptidyl-prolyl cis-trans isomerase C